MKTVYIITPHETYQIAESVDLILSYNGYNSIIITKNYDNVYTFISKITPKNCQLIISIDGFGFEIKAPDGGAYYNQTPVNVLAILFNHASFYESFLNQRINYTITFIVQSLTDKKYIQDHHSQILNIESMPDLEILPKFLDNFDWRY